MEEKLLYLISSEESPAENVLKRFDESLILRVNPKISLHKQVKTVEGPRKERGMDPYDPHFTFLYTPEVLRLGMAVGRHGYNVGLVVHQERDPLIEEWLSGKKLVE